MTDPPTVPFQIAHQSLALFCTAGERALGAPNIGFTHRALEADRPGFESAGFQLFDLGQVT